ncbi:hypothetical protein PUN28_002216 [Cardiocondyla obscurior]|uniref:Uncharacterized protein n=1 Tax=Cardiocondyla obscurior TaxID=286306 RepID=A0AAW2GT53_9HYME
MNMRKDDTILPDCNNWSKQNCVVKKRNFPTFQAAVKMKKYLSQFDNTDDEENENEGFRKKAALRDSVGQPPFSLKPVAAKSLKTTYI